jgi:sortase A
MRSVTRMRADSFVRCIERGLVALGAGCLIWVGAVLIYAVAYQVTQQARLDGLGPTLDWPVTDRGRDVALRSHNPADPIGRLEIPRVGLSTVVVEGDDEKTLQVAVGHLPDTPLPWQPGNAALAGHRDTFFRPLRRVQTGDDIRLDTPHGTFRYRVTRLLIVQPHELWVLDSSPAADLTLITCYPFNFVGPAPRRFVVHAERVRGASDFRTSA